MDNPRTDENGPRKQGDGDPETDRSERKLPTLSRRMVLGSTVAGVVGVVPPAMAAAPSGDSFTAVNDGNWSDSATWEQGRVPTDGSTVSIQDGVTVTVARSIPARVKYLNVAGTLRHAPDHGSKLRVETIQTQPGSTYEIGTSSTPIQRGVTAAVEFIDEGPIDEDEWPDRKGKGLLAHGDVEIHGARKTPWTTLANHPTAGDVSIELPAEPTNWNPGDEIVIPGAGYYTSTAPENEDEERTIASVDGTRVAFDTPLDYDHSPPKPDLDAYALNLSRNVVLASESTEIDRRGHVMIMSTGSKVRYARFDELGRTNKEEYITDPVRGEENLPDGLDPNPAARYPLHWHHTGIDAAEPHKVEGVVVDGSPGWGIVNHHAHAEVTDSITHNVLGSGFVAEGGNERGSFDNCLAIRSEGSGETIDSRAAGAHGSDPAIDDFGHAGHGFWLQSPLVEVTDCVAAGHRHQAFVWWLRPLLDGELAEGSDIEDSRVTYHPNLPMEYVDGADPMLEAIEEQRFAIADVDDRRMWETQKIPSTFAPIKKIRGNVAFASAGGVDFSRHNFKWIHERFGDFNTIEDMTVYNIGTFVDADGEEHSPDLPRHRSSGHQGRGGNVGVSFRYTSNVSLKNSRIIGTGREDSVGVPYHDYLWTNTVENCTIENWEWGVDTGEHRLTWIRDCTVRDNEYDVNWDFDNAGPAILEHNDLDLVRHKFTYSNRKASDVLTFSQQRGVSIDGRSAYVTESHPDFVPFPDEDALGGVNNIEDIDAVDNEEDLIGLTNAELMDEYGVCIGGRLLPADAVEEPYIEGSLLDPEEPRDPPTSVRLDATDGEIGDGFEVVSEAEAAGGECLSATGVIADPPGDGDGSNAASYSFDCAAGTYYLYARLWTDSWNGDTLYYRIDGGEWRAVPKLKPPSGFKWYEAAERNGPAHESDLSGGEHTLEIACGNDDVMIDEVLLASDATVVGAFGGSTTSDDEGNDDPPAVTTDAASSVDETSATLNGSLEDFGDASSADVYFEYRQTGASSWNATSTQTLSNAGAFSESVSGLEDGVDYEYRTVASGDGDTATGNSVTFTTTDDSPAVTTDSPSNAGDTSASLNGSLNDLGNASSADCYFEYRQSGASSWITTSKRTLSSTGTFSVDVTSLSTSTDYEYRAVVYGSDADSDTGGTVSFSTGSNNTAPSIDSYSVIEAGLPNPHYEITADWSVSDADGALDTVEVEVVEPSGLLVDSTTTAVSGSTASNIGEFKIKHVDGQSFDVALTVTDTEGKSSSQTRTVSDGSIDDSHDASDTADRHGRRRRL